MGTPDIKKVCSSHDYGRMEQLLVHIIGVPLTATSVNPARSLASAIFTGGDALAQVWLFIVVPLIGAALAAIVFI